MFHLILLGLIFSGLLYIIFRLILPAKLSKKQNLILSAVIVTLGLTYPTSHYIGHLDYWWYDGFCIIGTFAVGMLSTLVVLTLVKDLVLLVLLIFRVRLKKGRILLISVTSLSLLGTLLGYIIATTPQIVEVELPVRGTNSSIENLKIVQITDTHITNLISADWLGNVVEMVNEQNPDIIVVTGDFADLRLPDTENRLADFSKLRARYGVYGVLGNHEYYGGQLEEWVKTMNSLNVKILENENVIIEHEGVNILLGGITDNTATSRGINVPDTDKAIKSDTTSALKILLSHQPQNAVAASASGFDVQLSGHTHGGQFFPWNFMVDAIQDYFLGYYDVNGMSLYVSPGTGYWNIPNRLGTKSEISVINFKNK